MRSQVGLPVVVDFPESTWPITTTLMCIFSLLHSEEKSVSYPLRCIEIIYHRDDEGSMEILKVDSPHDCGFDMQRSVCEVVLFRKKVKLRKVSVI